MSIAETLMVTSRLTPSEAALVFARAGTPIFPCAVDGKRPLTHAGFLEASSSTDQVIEWWNRWPRANIGMPTGGASGVEVVDIDTTRSGSGFAEFERASAAGLVEGELARVRTPSGGMHVYFPVATDANQRCWQAAVAHIDFRGTGGYVVVPPSRLVIDGGRSGYRLFSASAAGGKPIDARALRSFIDPHRATGLPRTNTMSTVDSSRLARWVSELREGERNRGLFWAACRLAEAGLEPNAIAEALAPAAQSAGLGEIETAATIRSAGRQAKSRPPNSANATWRPDPTLQQKRLGDTPCLP
jgi:hypothetical protein